MLGLYIAAVLAAESSSGCLLPCGAVCLELIDHKDCRGSACSQQELEFGDLCTGDATCGDAGRCYVAAAETEVAATTWRRAPREACGFAGKPDELSGQYWTDSTPIPAQGMRQKADASKKDSKSSVAQAFSESLGLRN